MEVITERGRFNCTLYNTEEAAEKDGFSYWFTARKVSGISCKTLQVYLKDKYPDNEEKAGLYNLVAVVVTE